MAIGLFGGTFDPVHIGHLRTALELKQHLVVDQMLLVPSSDPPHRQSPATSAQQRLAMVSLAVADEEGLIADSRELDRGGLSYMVDTLRDLRAEIGPSEPLSLCIGMDSLVTLNHWHRWQECLDYSHIVVAARPGWQLPEEGEVAQWLQSHRVSDVGVLHTQPAGSIHIAEMTLLPISATEVRSLCAQQQSLRYLVPDAVIDYIRHHQLYR